MEGLHSGLFLLCANAALIPLAKRGGVLRGPPPPRGVGPRPAVFLPFAVLVAAALEGGVEARLAVFRLVPPDHGSDAPTKILWAGPLLASARARFLSVVMVHFPF